MDNIAFWDTDRLRSFAIELGIDDSNIVSRYGLLCAIYRAQGKSMLELERDASLADTVNSAIEA